MNLSNARVLCPSAVRPGEERGLDGCYARNGEQHNIKSINASYVFP